MMLNSRMYFQFLKIVILALTGEVWLSQVVAHEYAWEMKADFESLKFLFGFDNQRFYLFIGL